VLERGYSVVYDAAGNVVRAAQDVNVGDEISLKLARGRLFAAVTRKET
jgi:exonuclease VII large subunit